MNSIEYLSEHITFSATSTNLFQFPHYCLTLGARLSIALQDNFHLGKNIKHDEVKGKRRYLP